MVFLQFFLDSASIIQSFHQLFPATDSPVLLTDIYHAKMRVVKLLPRSHPDYKVSVQEMAAVLAKIRNQGYPKVEDLAESLHQWATQFKTPTEGSRYNTNEIILLLNKQRYVLFH